MLSVCCYFQVHQPYRLRRYSAFDIGRSEQYFDETENAAILRKVASKCYRPMNRLLLELIDRHAGRFKVAFSISGTAIDQFAEYAPDVLESFQELARTGCVEFLAETDQHSLSFLFDVEEFDRQVDSHLLRTAELFGQRPAVFRNTELVFNNQLAYHLEKRGFLGALCEGAERLLGWRSPNFLYTAAGARRLKVLLKNYKLSDDIAFRFGDRSWSAFPLNAERFAQWLNSNHGNGQVVNLFLDYETFGEHQWAETGIFDFMRQLPVELLRHPDTGFRTPSEVVSSCEPVGVLDIAEFVSWADTDRDLTAWLGNSMQEVAARAVYDLGPAVRERGDAEQLRSWRRLTTSDHLYYLCTKWSTDGDVHKYFSPYESPYDGYICLMNVLNDLAARLGVEADPGELLREEMISKGRLEGRTELFDPAVV